jgi:hypothetical protein
MKIKKTKFIKDIFAMLAEEINNVLPNEDEYLDYLRRTKAYINIRIEHIINIKTNKK